MIRTIFTLGLLALVSFGASANDMVSITCTKDNTIIQSATGVLSNALNFLTAGRTNQDGTGAVSLSIRRALVYFDIASNVPANATIDSVRLSMYFSKTSGIGTAVDLHRVQKDWGEGTSTQSGGQGAAATQNDVTWLYTFYNATAPASSPVWSTPGGDFDATASASTYAGIGTTGVEAYGIKTWSSATMTSEVERWLTAPATNFGWLLQGNESTGQTSKQFLSRENGTAETVPILKVYYTKSTANDIQSLEANTFSIYPNPTTDQVTVRFAEKNQEQILIYNLCGSIVKSVEQSNGLQTTIRLSDIKPGVYLVKAGVQTSKLVVK